MLMSKTFLYKNMKNDSTSVCYNMSFEKNDSISVCYNMSNRYKNIFIY